LPSVGRLDYLILPEDIRVETGVEQQDEVSQFYDPMIAKLVAHASTRDEAINLLLGELDRRPICWPVRTNAGFLYRAADSAKFRAGTITTSFLENNAVEIIPATDPPESMWRSAAWNLFPTGRPWWKESGPSGPWEGFNPVRLSAPQRARIMIQSGDSIRSLDLLEDGGDIGEHSATGFGRDPMLMRDRAQIYDFKIYEPRGSVGAAAADGAIHAPMPGKVTSVEVSQGENVAKGQRLMTLEAMKMEHGLVAPFDGVVVELNARAGAQVQVDALLARLEAEEK
jgi:3-methylcrotonyl-CoA carboxylase alpha subunit